MGSHCSPNTVTDGLVFYVDSNNEKSYPESGTTWKDLSSSGDDLTFFNTPLHTSEGFVFDGLDDRMVASEFVDYGTSNTWEVWFKRTNIAFVQRLLGNDDLSLYFVGAGTGSSCILGPSFNTSTNINTNLLCTVQSNLMNVWSHLVTTFDYDGSQTAVKVYYNGQFVPTTNAYQLFDGYIVYPDQIPLSLASISANSQTNLFGGNISNVKIYNRALSEDEVQQNFNALRGRYGI